MGEPRKSDRITPEDNASILYWSLQFDVTADELLEAVETVGDSVDAVAAYLNVDPPARFG